MDDNAERMIEAAAHVCTCRGCSPEVFIGTEYVPGDVRYIDAKMAAGRIKKVWLDGVEQDFAVVRINAVVVGERGWLRVFRQGPFVDWNGNVLATTHICLRCFPGPDPKRTQARPCEGIMWGKVEVGGVT